MTTVDHQIDYTVAAGKGAKRRRRLQLADEPKRRPKPKPYLQKPEFENRKVRRERMSEAYQSAMGVKARIRYLVIDHDMGYLDCMQTMQEQGYNLSGVTVGNIRREMGEVMKLLEKEGLLNVEALARRRKKVKARDY